ncbi:hypothetical protein MN032_02675 [Agromyces atrinae]|uniref:hypothetical protein n=1 Tax=Agromyces atrinae TaxID=592376 RepID=UPI001F569551|nr:hypothetical protein [Agromyces atrinae]MCI2956586.1 hypothetical protein [Agromyces atrinae]
MMFYDYTSTLILIVYALLLAAVVVVLVILVRLALAGTRALNAYTERTKIETAMMLAFDGDDAEPGDGTEPGTTPTA